MDSVLFSKTFNSLSKVDFSHYWLTADSNEEIYTLVENNAKTTRVAIKQFGSQEKAEKALCTKFCQAVKNLTKLVNEHEGPLTRTDVRNIKTLAENLKQISNAFTAKGDIANAERELKALALEAGIKRVGLRLVEIRQMDKAVRTGERVRKVVVLPSQLMPLLTEAFAGSSISEKDKLNLARSYCREILERATPENRGKSIRIEGEKSEHKFPILKDQHLIKKPNVSPVKVLAETESPKIPFDGHFKVSESGDSIELFLIPKEAAVEGVGSYTRASKSHSIKIPLNLERESGKKVRKSTHDPMVLRTEIVASPGQVKGDAIVAELIRLHPDLNVVSLPTLLPASSGASSSTGSVIAPPGDPSVPVTAPSTATAPTAPTSTPSAPPPARPKERAQQWYNSDLSKAMDSRKIPLDIYGSKKLRLNEVQLIDLIITAANTLKIFHDEGIIHHDIKGPNIFVEATGSTLVSKLADFDHTCPIGKKKTGAPYYYWDASAEHGLPLPSCDKNGIAVMLAELVIPNCKGIDPKLFSAPVGTEAESVERKQREYLLNKLRELKDYMPLGSKLARLEREPSLLPTIIRELETDPYCIDPDVVEDSIIKSVKSIATNVNNIRMFTLDASVKRELRSVIKTIPHPSPNITSFLTLLSAQPGPSLAVQRQRLAELLTTETDPKVQALLIKADRRSRGVESAYRFTVDVMTSGQRLYSLLCKNSAIVDLLKDPARPIGRKKEIIKLLEANVGFPSMDQMIDKLREMSGFFAEAP